MASKSAALKEHLHPVSVLITTHQNFSSTTHYTW